MITRRTLLIALGAAAVAVPFSASAQPQGKLWRIGYLAGGAGGSFAYFDFVSAMRELGYAEGKHYVIEWRSSEGRYERYPALAAELVRLNVDVIVVVARAANAAAKRATQTIPIVIISTPDPVAEGLASTLSRPGGNITGLASVTGEASPQYIEFLRVLMPRLSRVALLLNPDNPSSDISRDLEHAARPFGVRITTLNAKSEVQLKPALASLRREKMDGLVVTTDSFFFSHRELIAQLALSQGVPSIAGRREYAEAGFLMGYGESLAAARRRAAYYVDRIFKGAKPADLPFEKPMRLSLVINRKTATALGVKLPQELLLRADEVIG